MTSTKSGVLPTLRGFHYQILLGVEKCFELNEGQSIWFESDGDISILGDNIEDNEQIESKHYDTADALTNHHPNFWNTLNSWLKDEFNSAQYAFLILHTTQPTSPTSKLNAWNSKTPDEKLEILESIYNERTKEEKTDEKAKGVLKFQQNIFNSYNGDKLKDILSKMLINDRSCNIESLINDLLQKPTGIPQSNLRAYFQGVVGWVYSQMEQEKWCIDREQFREKLEELTAIYCRGEFRFPQFTGALANDVELSEYKQSLFVQKIEDIEHHEQIPEAVGNFAEFTNSLIEAVSYSPKYKDITKNYQCRLINKFKRFKQNISLEYSNCAKKDCAKIFYNKFIDEPPEQIQGCDATPKPYKNGLIHDSMDSEHEQLSWNID